MSPFLGNHDVDRFATHLSGNGEGPFGETVDRLGVDTGDAVTEGWLIDRIAMAFAFVLTQPGVPLIYYGDEIGLAGAGDPDNRRIMPQALNGNRLELLRRVQALGQARSTLPALRRGERNQLWVDENFYVYARVSEKGDEMALVAMNKGDTTRTETVDVPNALGLSGQVLLDILAPDAEGIEVANGKLTFVVAPWQTQIWTPQLPTTP